MIPPQPPKGRIRVLVVEDSGFMRGVIRQLLASDPQIEVVGLAADGVEAVAAVASLAPNVVTMDVQMPHADGLAAVARIMAERPTPILMISSHTREGSAATIRALELGAVDFVAKPSPSVAVGLETLRDTVIQKVKMAARVRPIRTAAPADGRALERGSARNARRSPASSRPGRSGPLCAVVAASTGGPAALLSLIPALPRDLPAPVVVVQHMPARYTAQLAREMAARSALSVKEAEDGERLAPGTVYVAPGAQDLTVSASGVVALGPAAHESGGPSADAAMTSVARHAGPLALGVVLTGMGRDGAAGSAAIRRAGGRVLAQDEASSLVYGMPRAAAEAGGVDVIVPLADLPERMVTCLRELAGHQRRGSDGA